MSEDISASLRDPGNQGLGGLNALAADRIDSLTTQLSQALWELGEVRADRDAVAKLVYVPGLWRCAKCDFTLIQANLGAFDGSVTARNEAGDHCPNDGAPLWRVTERQAGNDMVDRCEKAASDRDAALRSTAELTRILQAVWDDWEIATETWRDSAAGPASVPGERCELKETSPETVERVRTALASSSTKGEG